MNSKNKKIIGLVLISPAVLSVVGYMIFAVYVMFMTEPAVLLIMIVWIILLLLFLCGARMLI